MDFHDLTAFIIERRKKRFPEPDAVAKAIQKAARSSYRLPKTVNDSVNQVLFISIALMKALQAQIIEFDKAISVQLVLLPKVLISIPGIGPVYSTGIMTEIGDISRFNNQAALLNMQVLPGLNVNLVILKLKTQNLSDLVINFQSTICVKLHSLL